MLKSGGIYKPMHVEALVEQLLSHFPKGETLSILCLTDFPVTQFSKGIYGVVRFVPLRRGWPGWWSKMELFDPYIKNDLLFFDLDTIINGPLDNIVDVSVLTIVRDFYRNGICGGRAEGLQSCMMFLPEADRAEVWDAFARNPAQAMADCGHKGDQAFLERFYLQRAQRWQDVVPGQVVSYKVHCKNGVPPDARVICAHGKPKPWDVPEFKHLYE